ncbi:hypothetical protein DICPUDRAFT_89090 [Dictyostelium purpureum]|uniref:PH domain-containing protein n=1 Tax=Dictyostelium purpureum TaxID=5786 RepID=F0ZTM3_DICPU|nr:uncharacterized protein DICPUDRAFT_89090 [Dictyostelium purpureum]EGC32697.1 hypothetical protein DICPUDRAFT_89090 [Dictyostelium purpureum]|eukprot:XP_003290766.1 hypothetical protein DICPUDRAFT_89090 [Dictyostelium purpureum]
MSTLEQYLKVIGLESYQSIMIDNGYDDPELIAELTEDDLVAIGVKKGHAKRAFLKSKELSNKTVHTHEASPDISSNSSSSSAPPNSQQPPAKERTTTISIGKKGNDDDEDSGDEKDDKPSGPMLQSKVLHEGFVQKKGNEGFFGSKMFQKRYFKIYEEGRLAYFKNSHDVSPINVIEMRGALSVDDMENKNTGFKLSMKTSARVYWLVCQKLDEKQKWVQVIKSQITPPVVPKAVDPNEIKPYLQHREEPSQCASTRFDSPLSWGAIEKQSENGMIRLHIHSNGKLFVEEIRAIELDENNQVIIKDLPKEIDERSVHFLSLSEPAAFVMEQTYYHDEKTPEKMLEKLIGKEIEVSVPREDKFDEPVVFKGELIYNPKESQYALQNRETNTIHFLKTHEAISYNLLENQVEPIFKESQLDWIVAGNEKKHLIKLSYNSENLFKWHSNYVAVLNPRETEMEFRGWFTIENESGKTFNNTNVILVREPSEKKVDEKKDSDSDSALPVALPKLGGFKLGKLPSFGGDSSSTPAEPEKRIYRYEIPHKTTLKNNEQKQICFVSTKLPVRSFDFISFDTPKYTKYTNVNKDHGAVATAHVDSSVQFTWNLPYTIPAGSMKLQRQLKDHFGSDIVNSFEIEHFNPSDIVTLPLQPLGKVSATRTQTGYNFDINNLYIVETYEIRVNNGREEPVRITVEESMYRWEFFEITSSQLTDSNGTTNIKFINHPTHPRRVQWVLNIPPLDGKVIKYSVFYSGLSLPESMMPKK